LAHVRIGRTPDLGSSFRPLPPDDPELDWFVRQMPARLGSVEIGYPLEDVLPKGMDHLVSVTHEGYEPEIPGSIPPAVASMIIDAIDTPGTGSARALFWEGWGDFRSLPTVSDGLLVKDNYLTCFAYGVQGDLLEVLSRDFMTTPYRSPTYLWRPGHRWLVYTNIDARLSVIAFQSRADQLRALGAIPLSLDTVRSDHQ
jgi:hypothetical protein